jgi:DNA-binding response OmpR family regulator
MSESPRILIADDDADLREILQCVLEAAGFSVSATSDGAQALEVIRQAPPSLAILDYAMPGLTGPQVCDVLKRDLLLRHLPVILLTGRKEVEDKVQGLDAGADDYVLKPFEPEELLARVRMVLRRTAQELEANPLTRLPGNPSIQRELEQRLKGGESLAVCYVDLDRFKAFNDHFGFQRGDEVIRRTAELLLESMKTHGGAGDFLGHIGGDDFVLITRAERAEAICQAIIRGFDAMVPGLYDESDRARGYLLHVERQGQPVRLPLLSVSIALVTNEEQPLTHPGQVAAIGAELKTYAKRSDHSLYVKNRRKGLSV